MALRPVDDIDEFVRINAHSALGITYGATLEIFPPSSAMNAVPLYLAKVVQVEEDSVWVKVQLVEGAGERNPQVALGSRVRFRSFNNGPLLQLQVDDSAQDFLAPELSARFAQTANEFDVGLRVTARRQLELYNPAGDAILTCNINAGPTEINVALCGKLLHKLALFRHVLTLRNVTLADGPTSPVLIEIVEPNAFIEALPTHTVSGEQPITLRVFNTSSEPYYISLWLLDGRLGIHRIFPPSTTCLLLAPNRELYLNTPVQSLADALVEQELTFKLFATRTVANLDLFSSPLLDPTVTIYPAALSAFLYTGGGGTTPQPHSWPAPIAQTTLLFWGASPLDLPPLQIDQELRAIGAALLDSPFSGQVSLHSRTAVTQQGMLTSLTAANPTIIHFAGHASNESELLVMRDDGSSEAVSPQLLTSLFHESGAAVRGIFANTNFVQAAANELVKGVDFVVGFAAEVTDQAAIAFAKSFYQALFAGTTLKQAFDEATFVVSKMDVHLTPILVTRTPNIGHARFVPTYMVPTTR